MNQSQTTNFVDSLTVTLPRHVMSQVLAQARECDLTVDEWASVVLERHIATAEPIAKILEGIE